MQSLAGDAFVPDAEGGPVLIGGECEECGNLTYPRAAVCPVCMSEELQPVEMSREGILYSFTMVHVGPSHWKKPFALGYVDLPNGVRVFSHLRGDTIRIGCRMTLSTGELGHNPDGTTVTSFVFQPSET
ncbi:Zn-ribbon domain-containing OB-fold protein [Rhodoligotrophos appendicifer]|uniref:Zn-ribbon domain-containing OB-fold protein n=1 Tax=Rhodoligotrophos appendicifer TaxID=987056 RepID=UPI0024831A40|nr:OB-fold domain-containing protein [Rhodoligotrophos appendicifer]